MGKGEQKKGIQPDQPDLKVVEEEVVTRLEAASPKPGEEKSGAKKRSSLRREDRLPTATKEEMAVPSQVVDGIDVSETTEALRFPPALIALVGIVFLSLLGLGISLVVGARGGESTGEGSLSIQGRMEAQDAEELEARRLLAEITATLEGYCSATTIEERLPFIRHPERVRPLMEDYYRNRPFENLPGAKLVEQFPIPIENASFSVLTVVGENSEREIHLAEISDDFQVKIDWESAVCYQSVAISDLVEERPTEPFDIRVFAVPDNLYAYDFRDSEVYECLKLTFRDSEDYFFGYVEKGSPTFQKLYQYFANLAQAGPVGPSPMILKVHFLPDGKGENLLAIDEFVAPRWAFLENPDDE